MAEAEQIKRGDEVKDSVTGLKGIVVGEHLYLFGCRRLSVQPPIDKDGKHPDSIAFDESQLVLLKANKVACLNRDAILGESAAPPPLGGPTGNAETRPTPPHRR